MNNQLELSSPEEAKLHIIIEIGLDSSVMRRVFEKGSMKTLRAKLRDELPRVLEAESEEQYRSIHSSICRWGTKNIKLAKGSGHASYGQIAKTLNVALKVVVYYCHLPDCEKSQLISKWLNAAVDTKMMAWLKKQYAEDTKSWPTALGRVDGPTYASIQETVHKFINGRPGDRITPVQFDDMYWEWLNRQAIIKEAEKKH